MSSSEVVGGILCAGFGTRLRPLTSTVPKPLMPFLNTPLISYALDHLASAGVGRAAANLHHLAEAIPPVADRIAGQMGLEIAYAREWEILGTAGGIAGMWRALEAPDATLVVFNGDSVMNIDLPRHLAEHRRAGRDATLVVRPVADDQPGGVWVDGDGRLRGIRDYRDPDGRGDLEEYDFTGVHILEPDLLDRIPVEEGDVIDEVYGPRLERGEGITASIHEDFWAALDNPELFFSVTCEVLEEPDRFDQAPLGSPRGGGIFAAEGVELPDALEVQPPVFVGPDVTWNGGVQLGPYAVVDGVEIAEGAEVARSIVYGTEGAAGQVEGQIAVADQRVEHDA